jgi:hypothetical protein
VGREDRNGTNLAPLERLEKLAAGLAERVSERADYIDTMHTVSARFLLSVHGEMTALKQQALDQTRRANKLAVELNRQLALSKKTAELARTYAQGLGRAAAALEGEKG